VERDSRFQSDWHPHARFHAVQLVWLGTCLSAAAFWLLWRRSREPAVTALVVAAFAVVLWGGELFAGLVSGTDPSPDPARPPVLQDVFGERSVAHTTLEVSQECAMVLEQRLDWSRSRVGVHLTMIAPAVVVGYAEEMRAARLAIAGAMTLASLGCDDGPAAPTSQSGTATVRIVFLDSTTRRSDLPSSAQACVSGVGVTHSHPSWRNFAGIPLQPSPPDRYEITFTDVPVNMRVSFRVNDQNACDENPTGAVTRNVFANDVRLVQNTTTPGNGDEPGYALTVTANGMISQ
jgi:hypothetical protein